MFQTALDAARAADMCIAVVGTHGAWEVESVDQPHMRLLGEQSNLMEQVAQVSRGPVIAVLNVGSPKELPWIDAIPSVLLAHYGGEEMANAVASAILGGCNPAGRLPTTWPKT